LRITFQISHAAFCGIGCDAWFDSFGGTVMIACMEYDKDKVDEAVLALLFLTQCGGGRAWKGHDWDALGRLHEKGMILDPVGKAKSVMLTEEGEKRCEELFFKLFGATKQT
jgi:hypothetical protein